MIEFLQVIILNHVFDKKIDNCRLNLQYYFISCLFSANISIPANTKPVKTNVK